MYLHIGNDQMVSLEDVIMILDYQKINDSAEGKSSRVFWQTGKKDCKSIVVTENKIFYSPISSATLVKRSS